MVYSRTILSCITPTVLIGIVGFKLLSIFFISMSESLGLTMLFSSIYITFHSDRRYCLVAKCGLCSL